MTIRDKTPSAQTQSLMFELELEHSPAKVWRALTEPELLKEWLLPAVDLKLEAGAAFTLKAPAFPGWDGTVSCQFVEIEPLRKLAYTWRVPFLETVVTFTLTPTATGTRLLIEQAGFDEQQRREHGGARYGWNMMSGRLIELLGRLS